MTEVFDADARIRSRPTSRQPSPIPRRQLGMLPLNQRSYSRMSSKGMLGDDSTLMSPLPFYPRRRSVKFAGDESREERPCYNPTFSASAPVSPVRTRDASPPPVSILKPNSSYPDAEPNAAAPRPQPPAARPSRNASPVPPRGRSASRQRIAARRREAQLHHSFYDDSFVEEFVLSTKSEQEKEDAQRRLEREMQREQERARLAEERSKESNGKIEALLHAKEVLRAAAKRHRSSETPSPSRNASRPARRAEAEALKTLEEDSDPDVQQALAEIAATTTTTTAGHHHKAGRHAAASRRRRSQPIASEHALLDADASDVDGDGDEQGKYGEDRKRAKLEKIVSNILTKQAKSKSKHSVVVINWSDSESQREDSGAPARPARPARRERSRSADLAPAARQASHRKGGSSKRAVSSRKRSVVPDLGDSLLFEDEAEQPILLPRRTHKRPATTRSISQLDAEADDAVLDEADIEKVIRKPPRAPRRAPAKQPARKNQVRPNSDSNSGTAMNSAFTSTRSEPYASEAEGMAAPVRRRAPRTNASKADADDPMSVFFNAAFPSPSKFDEMMVRAGGLPEGRRGGRGQPNLVLPSSIGRRR